MLRRLAGRIARRTNLLAVVAVAIAGCATAPREDAAAPPWADAQFERSGPPVDPASLFALDDAMRRFLETGITAHGADARRALVEALRGHDLRIDYDASVTRTATQTFAARSGNCLSLVVMTAALAKALGLAVHYQSVVVDRTWTRSGDLYVASGHVNLSLGRKAQRAWRGDDHDRLVIDFVPPEDLSTLRTVPLAETTVVAMYLNNRAAELLAAGDVDAAYWHAREATRSDPSFVAAYNTLAVVYLRRGLLAHAEAALQTVLAHDAGHTSAMANLVPVLQRQGRNDEAAMWRERLARAEAHPPFHFLLRGQQAMRDGQPQLAKTWFRRELDRDPAAHEARYWLAAAHQALGETEQARRELALAVEYSTTRAERDRYAAKLGRLQGAATRAGDGS